MIECSSVATAEGVLWEKVWLMCKNHLYGLEGCGHIGILILVQMMVGLYLHGCCGYTVCTLPDDPCEPNILIRDKGCLYDSLILGASAR